MGGNDLLEGGSGDDELIGFGGIDTITGGTGADTAFGGPLDDAIDGGSGDDRLWGNFGSDTITGGSGADFIDGDNPFPTPPDTLFPPGTNNDDCRGGSGPELLGRELRVLVCRRLMSSPVDRSGSRAVHAVGTWRTLRSA